MIFFEKFEIKNKLIKNNIEIPITEFFNVNIVNYNKNVIHIKDDVFIAFLDDKIHHLLLDNIVQYEYLKSTLYPNLKLLFFKNEHYVETKFSKFIFDMYSGFNNLFDINQDDIKIDKYITVYEEGTYKSLLSHEYLNSMNVKNSYLFYDNYIKTGEDPIPFKTLNIDYIQNNGLDLMVDKIRNKIPKTKNKKVYISRTLANEKHKKLVEPESKLRYYEDEYIVEQYFNDLGYESVHLETMAPADQIKLMRDADEVAGLQGTGMLLTIFCDPGTKIYEIMAIKNWNTSYKTFNFIAGNIQYSIDITNSKTEEIVRDIKWQINTYGLSPKLIIFDLDGVLVDSKEIHYKALNEALLEIDEKYIISLNDQETIFEGLSTNKKLEILTKTRGLPESLYNKIWSSKQEKSIKFFNLLKKDYELINIMKNLKKCNIKIAVASNSIKRTVELCLKNLGIIDFIDIYMSNESVEKNKPFPDIYNTCIEKFGFEKNDVVIIEDSFVGKMSAINSGARLVSVRNRNDVSNLLINQIIVNQQRGFNILIPMAGQGKRMREAGWDLPKPLILIDGKPMIQVVIENIALHGTYICVVNQEDIDKYEIDKHIKNINSEIKIVIQDKILEGAALSTLVAEKYIDNDEPLLIVNSDQYVSWDNSIIKKLISSGVDGCLLSFKDKDPKWSFSKLNEHNFVTAVSEKNPISDNASCGIYYWQKGSDYVKYAKSMIQKNIRTSGEFYVCPVYNEAIEDQKVITISMVDKMYGLGTPEDLTYFLKNIDQIYK